LLSATIVTVKERVGLRIKALREARGWSQGQLSAVSGIPRPTITQIEAKSDPRAATLSKIANAFDITVEELFGKPKIEKESPERLWEKLKAYQPVSVPVRGSVPSGVVEAEEEPVEEHINIQRELLRGKHEHGIYALRVNGQSLVGDGIQPGDYVVVELGASVVDGKIYIIRMDKKVVARHIHRINGKYKLTATNGDYREIEPDQVEVLGRVIFSGSWKEH
jgi:SOS-response transcriptional repressor LexA